MNRAMILDLLNQHRDELLKRFGAKHLALFGSAARDELRVDSDIDVLVEFDGPAIRWLRGSRGLSRGPSRSQG